MIKYLTKINKTENIKIKHSKYEQTVIYIEYSVNWYTK